MQIQARARNREHHPIRCITLVKAAAVVVLALLASCGGGSGTEPQESINTDAKSGMHVDVAALFPNNGAKWNDYVRGNRFTVTDTPCNAVTDTACLHGGERRVVVIKSKTSCSGLVATDDLGAFNWVCDDSGKRVRLISTGLAEGKFLSDLVDFTTKRFKLNKVTVKANGVAWIVTPSTVWWTNPIVENNVGGSLAAASTVYLVTNNAAASYFLDADKVALVIQPGVTLTGPGTIFCCVIFSNHHNLWLEGAMNASGGDNGVVLDSVRFSTLRNLAAGNTDVGVVLNNASNNTLSGVTANNNTNVGVVLVGASNNTLSLVMGNNNVNHGVLLDFASNHNTLSGVTASNNATNGLTVANASNNNTITGVMANNNTNFGVTVSGASQNKLSDVTASNNAVVGVGLVDGATNNTLSGVTASNNSIGVFLVNASSNNTLAGVTASNNANWGVLVNIGSNSNTLFEVAASHNYHGVGLVNHSDNETLSDVVAGNNDGSAIILSESSYNRFTGLLEVGSAGDCSVRLGILPGLDQCFNNGSSNATLITGITLAGSFVGKVTSDDTKNANDTNGAATFPSDPAVFDWTHFDNAYRGWGIDGSIFPDPNQRGPWATGAGRIWDWSVSSRDNGANGTTSCTTAPCPALLRVLPLPTGNDTLTHAWSGIPGTLDNSGCDAMVPGSKWNGSICATTFLRNAVELPGAGGNDNNLCESGETCLYTPNMGSYQGHGNLVSAGIIIDGLLTGISLMKYEINGR